jgi:hypothetical protein
MPIAGGQKRQWLSAPVRCLRFLTAIAAKFGTASDAERSLFLLIIINDLGPGYCFHLDESDLAVDDRKESCGISHKCECFGQPQHLGNRSPDIDMEMARTWTLAASELRAAS